MVQFAFTLLLPLSCVLALYVSSDVRFYYYVSKRNTEKWKEKKALTQSTKCLICMQLNKNKNHCFCFSALVSANAYQPLLFLLRFLHIFVLFPLFRVFKLIACKYELRRCELNGCDGFAVLAFGYVFSFVVLFTRCN